MIDYSTSYLFLAVIDQYMNSKTISQGFTRRMQIVTRLKNDWVSTVILDRKGCLNFTAVYSILMESYFLRWTAGEMKSIHFCLYTSPVGCKYQLRFPLSFHKTITVGARVSINAIYYAIFSKVFSFCFFVQSYPLRGPLCMRLYILCDFSFIHNAQSMVVYYRLLHAVIINVCVEFQLVKQLVFITIS